MTEQRNETMLCSQCGERAAVMVKIGTDDGWCTTCLDEAAEPPPPYEPPGLREVVEAFEYKPGWLFRLGLFREDDEVRGWALYVTSSTVNSYDHSETDYRVLHEFLVPPASYVPEVWEAWLLDRCGDIELHERNEFALFDGVRKFGPHHGNGQDPYRTWYVGTLAQTRTKFGHDDPED